MKRLTVLLSVSALASLGACSSESGSAGPADLASAPSTNAGQPAAPPSGEPQDPTAGMARAVGSGKPGAAVQLKYELGAKPAVGSPTEVEIALIPAAGVEWMEATFSGMDGVTLTGPLSATFTQIEAGKPYTHKLSLLPDRTGVFYITAAVTTQMGGASLSRTFSIPFVVGAPPVKQKSQPAKDASGQAIHEMQAEETTG